MHKEITEEDRVFFRIGLGILGTVLLVLLLRKCFPALGALEWKIPCPFYALTGLYCPGCGGQRAVRALLHGEILLSLSYHPLVLFAALYAAAFLGTQALNRLSRGKTPALSIRSWHLYILLGILILQWIVKNILLALGQYQIN